MHCSFYIKGVNKYSHHAVVVQSANAHVTSSDGYVSYLREITEGGPFVRSVRTRLAGLLLFVPHVVVPEVRVGLCLG